MDDSMEDFIRISRNVKSDEPQKMKEDININVQRKKDCDMRALKIVEFSIEGKLRPEIFTRCLSPVHEPCKVTYIFLMNSVGQYLNLSFLDLPYITQSHYQDIVEERAITRLCGYSICGKQIPDMPKKQYYISTKSNKVFDITERKNFCSNYCYKASLHIKKQIDDSPLWMRKLEDIPEYQLMGNNESGLPGECINHGIARPVVETSFTSVSTFAEVSLDDVADKEVGGEKTRQNKNRRSHKKTSKLIKTMQTISEQLGDEETDSLKENIEIHKPPAQNQETSCSRTLPIIVENDETIENRLEETKTNNESPVKPHSKKLKKKSSKLSSRVDAESLIKKVMRDWLSLETYIFLYGESKVKRILSEKKLSDVFDQLHIGESQRNQQTKYMDICKRLHLQEMADDKFDSAIIGNSNLRPPPDFSRLKEENKDLNIKVKCFYSGMLHEKEDKNFPTKINQAESSEERTTVLPLVDVNSQKAMRRKIFLNAINKSMHQLLQALRVRSFTFILSDLQHLVKTFRLKPDNIVFKPALWNHIAVVLLYILSIKDPNIKSIIDEASSQEYIKLQLSTLPSKEALVSDIIMDVQNIDMFVEQFIFSN